MAVGRVLFPLPGFAQIGFAAGVFIITLIVVSLITFRISDRVLDSRVGALDRTMGFIFGLARGFLLVAIVFILFSALARDQPDLDHRGASPIPILKQTQVAIESLMPHEPGAISAGGKDEEAPEGQPAAPGAQPGAPSDAAPAAPAPDQRSEGPKSLEPVVWTRAACGIEALIRAPIY